MKLKISVRPFAWKSICQFQCTDNCLFTFGRINWICQSRPHRENSPVTQTSPEPLENRYGFWPQTGCVTVPGREATFLVARQRFPYRSRFNFSVTNMENMLPCNAICDIMHIDFSRKIYCGANDAQNVNGRDVLGHFAPVNRSYWQCIDWNAHELFSIGDEW